MIGLLSAPFRSLAIGGHEFQTMHGEMLFSNGSEREISIRIHVLDAGGTDIIAELR